LKDLLLTSNLSLGPFNHLLEIEALFIVWKKRQTRDSVWGSPLQAAIVTALPSGMTGLGEGLKSKGNIPSTENA
jgi:hypothetical protein